MNSLKINLPVLLPRKCLIHTNRAMTIEFVLSLFTKICRFLSAQSLFPYNHPHSVFDKLKMEWATKQNKNTQWINKNEAEMSVNVNSVSHLEKCQGNGFHQITNYHSLRSNQQMFRTKFYMTVLCCSELTAFVCLCTMDFNTKK